MNRCHSFERVTCLAVMMFTASAHAQDRFDVEAMDPAPASAGSVFNVYGARVLDRGAYSLALQGSYARKPLSIENQAGNELGDLVGSVGTLQLLGAIGVYKQFDVGIGIPVHRLAAGSSYETEPPGAVRAATLGKSSVAMGDIRIVPRVSLYEHAGRAGFDVAMLASVWLPTGGNSDYAGESLRFEPRLAVDYAARNWLVAFNAGYLVRGVANLLGSVVDDQLRFGLGGSVDLVRNLSLLVEGGMNLNVLADNFGSDDIASEALAGLRYRAGGMVAQLAAGPGIARGMTAPLYRVLASIELGGKLTRKVEDADHDSLSDDMDNCVDQAEDRDDYEDQDGCPDLDNDNDGVADLADRCMALAEDRDNFQDEDGCPEDDNDADAIADASDRCPNEAEDRDGFQDEDGCPDADNDQDGIADASDKCPLQAGLAAEQGCPKAPEPAAPAAATITNDKIELRETVLFGNNNADIQAASNPLLDEIVRLLAQHTEIARVMIEGHTDDRGGKAHNQKLSEARALAVMNALVQRGITPTRLGSVGFGPTQPLVPNDSADNRAKNRRVELRIEKRLTP